ncbi:MAG: hypothetical protein ISR47_03700 [Rhodospirillales bacterium]|nr:hypothetical protein [Rhodospirillales bacterium]
MDAENKTYDERSLIIERGMREYGLKEAAAGRGRRAIKEKNVGVSLLNEIAKAVGGGTKSNIGLDTFDEMWGIAQIEDNREGMNRDAKLSINLGLYEGGHRVLSDTDKAAIDTVGDEANKHGRNGMEEGEAAQKGVNAGLGTLGLSPSIQATPKRSKEQTANSVLHTPKTRSWPAGKYPSTPMKFGGTNVNVRTNPKPTAPKKPSVPLKSWAEVQKAKEKRIAEDEADTGKGKKDGKKTTPHSYDEVGIGGSSLGGNGAKKSTRHHTYNEVGRRGFSLREDRSKAGAARKSVSAPTAASRTTARTDDDGGSDRDDPPSKPSAPQKTVDYEFEAIHQSSGGNDRDDGPGEPDSSKDRSENGWSGMGQNEQWHDGGVVTDHDPVIDEVAINVTAQEGEFVLSRAALAMLGEDLMGRVNRALRTGDSQTISRLRHVLHSTLGGHDALPEADIKASMNERAYWDQTDPGHTSAHARVAREFRVAFPGHSDMDKAEHIGGMITDHDPDTYLDDYKIDIPEGAFVVSRTATRLAGLPALMRLNALAEGSDAALAATLKRELEAALGITRPAGEAELKAMMHDPRYADPQHPEHIAYRQMIADGFRAAFGG